MSLSAPCSIVALSSLSTKFSAATAAAQALSSSFGDAVRAGAWASERYTRPRHLQALVDGAVAVTVLLAPDAPSTAAAAAVGEGDSAHGPGILRDARELMDLAGVLSGQGGNSHSVMSAAAFASALEDECTTTVRLTRDVRACGRVRDSMVARRRGSWARALWLGWVLMRKFDFVLLELVSGACFVSSTVVLRVSAGGGFFVVCDFVSRRHSSLPSCRPALACVLLSF